MVKSKALPITLLVTAILSLLAVVLRFSWSELFGEAVCFPFVQIGMGLRWLSLQGGVSNVIAIVIYIAVCLSPLLLLVPRLTSKTVHAEDSLAVVLSLLLFYVVYMMINPGLIPLPTSLGLGSIVAKALLCSAVYSVIVTYAVLRATRLFLRSGTAKLHRYMVTLLSLIAVLFTVSICYVGLGNALSQAEAIKTANTGTQGGLGLTYLFVIIGFAVDSIASLVSIAIVFSAITFLTEYSSDAYSEGVVAASAKLSQVCTVGLVVTVCSNTAFNLLQLIFMSNLRTINSFINIPLFSVAFALGALILCKIVMASKSLKDDNDSII